MALAHEVLSAGLTIVARTNPVYVLEYLLRDARRLALGLEGRRHATSATLISSVHPRLDAGDRARLETAVASFVMYHAGPDDDGEKKKAVANWNREHRLHLFSALSVDTVPSELRRVIAEERRRFPNFEKNEPRIRGGVVGARMRSNEMERASDEDLLNLFGEITDVFDERWLGSKRDVSRAGGSGELARELEAMVKKGPARGLRLLPHLVPDKHQKYAAAIVTALAEAMKAADVEAIVAELDGRGFRSEGFRVEVASALEKCAKTAGGLSDSSIEMLTEWLRAMEPAESESRVVGGSQNGPIIFAPQIILFGGASRAGIMGAIGDGLLERRPPQVGRWLQIVREELKRDSQSGFWEQVLANMVTPLNERDAETNEVLDDIITAHPHVLERQSAVWFLGVFMRRLEPARARRWLERLRAGSHDMEKQAYGELLVAYAAWHDDEWSRRRLESAAREEVEGKVIIGIAYASDYVWILPRLRSVMAEILIRFTQLPTEQDSTPLARFIAERMEDESIDPDTERVIRALLANDALLVTLASDLLALMEPVAVRHPDLAASVTRRVFDVAGSALTDVTKMRGFVTADLTSITLTLHRQTRYRQLGLDLFERMIELDLREAQAALEILDRKPTRRLSSSFARRRHWRRGRRQSVK